MHGDFEDELVEPVIGHGPKALIGLFRAPGILYAPAIDGAVVCDIGAGTHHRVGHHGLVQAQTLRLVQIHLHAVEGLIIVQVLGPHAVLIIGLLVGIAAEPNRLTVFDGGTRGIAQHLHRRVQIGHALTCHVAQVLHGVELAIGIARIVDHAHVLA